MSRSRPFTLLPPTDAFDARHVSATKRREIRQQAEAAGLEVIGLHWLLAKTIGFYLTSPDGATRRATADYLKALVELCGELGGTLMVLGSPQQRNLLPGVGYNDAESYAAEILREAMPTCAAHNVTIAVEPLGPAEGNFMLTAKSGIHLGRARRIAPLPAASRREGDVERGGANRRHHPR